MEIIPHWIFLRNDIDFQLTRPLLHRLLALNGEVDVAKTLKPNKSFDIIFLRETFDETFFVLGHARWQITTDTDVKCPILLDGHDVDAVNLLFKVGDVVHGEIVAYPTWAVTSHIPQTVIPALVAGTHLSTRRNARYCAQSNTEPAALWVAGINPAMTEGE
jgi:hypothetical protein